MKESSPSADTGVQEMLHNLTIKNGMYAKICYYFSYFMYNISLNATKDNLYLAGLQTIVIIKQSNKKEKASLYNAVALQEEFRLSP